MGGTSLTIVPYLYVEANEYFERHFFIKDHVQRLRLEAQQLVGAE